MLKSSVICSAISGWRAPNLHSWGIAVYSWQWLIIYRTPGVFTSKDLDLVAKEQIENDKSVNSIYLEIKRVLGKNIGFDAGGYPESHRSELTRTIESKVLPKFDRNLDKVNGLGLTVHDMYATQVTMTSLNVSKNAYEANVHYRMQDHFGLDSNDITHWLYSHWDAFKICFVLQHYEKRDMRLSHLL